MVKIQIKSLRAWIRLLPTILWVLRSNIWEIPLLHLPLTSSNRILRHGIRLRGHICPILLKLITFLFFCLTYISILSNSFKFKHKSYSSQLLFILSRVLYYCNKRPLVYDSEIVGLNFIL